MDCIYCGHKTRTANSRRSSKGQLTWRRRRCISCQAVFTTGEHADLGLAIRVKHKTALQPFLYEKLYLDVYDSLTHRKTAYTDAKQLCATIISTLIPCKTGVLEEIDIKKAVLDVLKRFDKVAFTYYKAHHN